MAANRYPLISTLVLCAAEAFENGHMPIVTQLLCDEAVVHTVWLLDPEPTQDLSDRTMALLDVEFAQWATLNRDMKGTAQVDKDEQNKVLMVYCVMSMGESIPVMDVEGEAIYDEVIESAAAMLRKVLML